MKCKYAAELMQRAMSRCKEGMCICMNEGTRRIRECRLQPLRKVRCCWW